MIDEATQDQALLYGLQFNSARHDLAAAELRADLAQMQVVTLTSKLEADYVASVAWDEQHQSGVLRVTRLPENAADKAYQLWVIDAATEKPVSAGIFNLGADGTIRESSEGSLLFKDDATPWPGRRAHEGRQDVNATRRRSGTLITHHSSLITHHSSLKTQNSKLDTRHPTVDTRT